VADGKRKNFSSLPFHFSLERGEELLFSAGSDLRAKDKGLLSRPFPFFLPVLYSQSLSFPLPLSSGCLGVSPDGRERSPLFLFSVFRTVGLIPLSPVALSGGFLPSAQGPVLKERPCFLKWGWKGLPLYGCSRGTTRSWGTKILFFVVAFFPSSLFSLRSKVPTNFPFTHQRRRAGPS